MLARDHQITSVATVISSEVYFGLPNVTLLQNGILLGSVLIGALMPDIDHANSKVSKFVKVPLYRLMHHRGFMHSIFGWGLISGLLYAILYYTHQLNLLSQPQHNLWFYLWLGITVGYLLHLIEDGASVGGIRWLAPFQPYDQYVYSHHQQYVKRPVRYRKGRSRNAKKIPIRHWWGRGYQVGSGEETIIVVLVLLITAFGILRWLWLTY